MSKYKFLIFDLDDTLLDFKDSEIKALGAIFKKYEIEFKEENIEKYRKINKSLWQKLEEGHITKKEVLNGRFKEFFMSFERQVDGEIIEKEYRLHLNNGHKLLPRAVEVLSTLRERNYKIFAGTNGVGVTQRKRLKDSKLENLFDDLFISEELEVEKPNEEFFKAIFEKHSLLKKEEILMIGDTLSSDIKGANNIGIDSVWFNPLKKESLDIRATYEIDNLNQLLEILK